MFATLSSYAVSRWAEPDLQQPTLVAEDQRRRDALIGAVTPSAPDWSDRQRRQAAAMLDVLWSVPSYERLTSAWDFDGDEATQVIAWMIGLLVDAIRHDRRPG